MSPNEHLDDELDRLLEQARWPATRTDQLARLRDRWHRLRHRRRRRFTAGLAAAAALLVAAGITLWRSSGTAEAPPVAQAEPPAPPTVAEQPPDASPDHAAGEAIVGRDPNLYERVVLAATMPSPDGQVIDIEQVERLIAALADDPDANIAGDVASPRRFARHERRLWKAVRGDDAKRRLGAARLLARVGTRRSLPVLEELLADPATHAAALRGASRLVDDRSLARLAAAEPDAALRRELLQTLAARDSRAAAGLYLEFVRDERSGSEALKAIVDSQRAAVDQLFAYLESPQPAVRLSAARALAALTDPAVIERLAQSLDGIGRREAIVALLSSPSAEAARYVDQARQNLYLVATVRAAEQQLHSQFPSRGGPRP